MAVRKKATRKKTATRKKAVAKRSTGTAMASWEEQLEKEAQEEADRTGKGTGEGQFISIRGGKFTYQGESLGDEVDLIVLESVYSREYYDRNFDPDSPFPPACFNIASSIEDITGPHETSPNPQCDTCEECEQNEWGSSGYGQSKACGAKTILCVMDPEGLADDEYQPAYIRAGVNSMLNWDGYVKGLAKRVKRPAYAVVTTMYFDDEASQPILKFKMKETINNKTAIEKIYERRDGLQEDMLEPKYNVDDYEKPAPTKRGGRRKAPVKKKGGRRSKLSR